MKNTWRYIVGVLGLAGFLYYGPSALEALNAPTLPPVSEQFKLHIARIDAIVDQHWSREGAIPTADELSAYRDLIDTLNKVDYAPLIQAHERGKRLEGPARQLYLQRSASYVGMYYMLESYVGESASIVLSDILHGPALAAADYNSKQAQEYRMGASVMINLRHDARYHLAMALIFAGDNQGAIEQVKLLLKENPDWVHTSIPYFIAVRTNAVKDPAFLAALEAAGVSSETFRHDLAIYGSAKLFPFYGRRRHEPQ